MWTLMDPQTREEVWLYYMLSIQANGSNELCIRILRNLLVIIT